MATMAGTPGRAGPRRVARPFFAERHAGTAALLGLLTLVLVGTVLGYLAGTVLAGLLSHIGLSHVSPPSI
jgi:hypothetical protein